MQTTTTVGEQFGFGQSLFVCGRQFFRALSGCWSMFIASPGFIAVMRIWCRLDKEQLMSVLSELEPFQTQLPRHRSDKPIPRVGGPLPVTRPASSGDSWSIEKWKKHVTLSVPSSTSDSPSYERGKNLKSSVTTSENRSTGSDSNSHSDESNDELQSGSVRRGKIEQDAQSKKEVDGSRQAHGDGTEVDPSLDPKKAKR